MPTIVRKLPISYPGSVVGNFVPTPTEVQIFKDSRVLNWWRAEEGFTAAGWECRKTGFTLTPINSTLPTKQLDVNNNPVLRFGNGTTNGMLSSGTIPLLPVGSDFTIILVLSNNNSDNAYVVTNGLPPTDASSFYIQLGSALSTSFKMGTRSVSSTTGHTPLSPATDLHIGTYSISDTGNTASLRYDAGVSNYSTGSATDSNTNGVLRLGGGLTSGGVPTGTFDSGIVAEMFILNCATHLPDHTDIRDKIETYLSARYLI